MSYPKREPFFAHRLTRLLFKSCAAQSIGQDATLLVIHIVHTEDAARYQGPVRFWNSQLNEVLGFRSPKSLNNARSKAVDAGWLVYQRRNDRTDGLYYTTIPPNVEKFDDEPIESIPLSVPESVPSTESIPSSVPSTEQKAERESYALRNGKVTGNDPPPIPVPVPVPNPIDDDDDDDASDFSIWVDWWNGLATEKMVPAGVRKTSTLRKKFTSAMKNAELRDLLNRDEIEKQIRQSEFVRGPWFTFAKLLGAKNKSGDLILESLLNGAYSKRFGATVNVGEGVNFNGGECNNEF